MVKVVRQKPGGKKPVKKTSSVLDRITPVGEYTPALRMNIYGRGKTGKTRFVCTWAKPMLLIGCNENGTLSVSTVKGVDFVNIQRTHELEELIELLKEGKYKSVGLDHGGGLQDIVMQEVLGLEDIPVQKSWGMATRDDWSVCGVQTKERMRMLLSLAETHNVNVGIIAHERNFKDEGDSSVIFPTVGAALQPSVTNWLNGACDYLCQTFIREQEITTKKQVGKIIKTTVKKTDKKEFCLRIGPHPVYMTGFRSAPEVVLPEVLVDPTYDKVMKLVKGN